MASNNVTASGRTLVAQNRITKAVPQVEEEIRIHWNGRRGEGAALELSACAGDGRRVWTDIYRISLGAFLTGLGLEPEDCRLAYEAFLDHEDQRTTVDRVKGAAA